MEKFDSHFTENEMAKMLPLVYLFADIKEIKVGITSFIKPTKSEYHVTDKYATLNFHKPISKILDTLNEQ